LCPAGAVSSTAHQHFGFAAIPAEAGTGRRANPARSVPARVRGNQDPLCNAARPAISAFNCLRADQLGSAFGEALLKFLVGAAQRGFGLFAR
jgi:hypothetical protein